MKKFLTLAVLATVFSAPAFAGGHNKFADKDLDGNGSISKDEMLSYAESKFDKMDANGDGEVTKAEAMEYKAGKKANKKDDHGHDDHHSHD